MHHATSCNHPVSHGRDIKFQVPEAVRIIVFLMLFIATSVQAECALDRARWAYDEEKRILRLCVEIDGAEQLRCTTFPQTVVIDPFSF